jgi:hypothetical protein
MTFWERLLILSDVAIWTPVGVGIVARVCFFEPGKNVADQEADPSPAPDADDFRLDNDEPEAGDPNFVSYSDRPLPRGS